MAHTTMLHVLGSHLPFGPIRPEPAQVFGDQPHLGRAHRATGFRHVDADEPGFDAPRRFRFELGHVRAVAAGVDGVLEGISSVVGATPDLDHRQRLFAGAGEGAGHVFAEQHKVRPVAAQRPLPGNPAMSVTRAQQPVIDLRMEDVFLAAEGCGVGEDGGEEFGGDVRVLLLWVAALGDKLSWLRRMACIVHIKDETLEETYRSRWARSFCAYSPASSFWATSLSRWPAGCRRSQRGVPVLHVRRDVDAVDAIPDAGEFE